MRWLVTAVVFATFASACDSHSTQSRNARTVVPDAGFVADAGIAPDAGVIRDAGTADAGAPDAGAFAWTELTEGPPLAAPDEVITAGNGLPDSFIDAQHDAAGNMWAVTSSNLYLRRAAFIAWDSFDRSDGLYDEEILSVGGGVGGTAWVGYKGLGWGDATDPPSWWYTGGTDKVVLNGANIAVTHHALVSLPGMYSQYPQGRFKLRETLRIYPTKTGQFAGDAWFGCNHGAAEVSAGNLVWEHQHPLYCVWDPADNTCSTTHEGYVPAVGFYASGDVLFGGSYGIMSLDYADGEPGGDFWGKQPLHNLSLFDHPLSSDLVDSQDVVGIAAAVDNSVWASSHHSGIAHLHADGRTIDIFQETQGLPTNDIEDSALDSQGYLWLATTQDGLVRINLATGVWQPAPGLPSQYFRRIMFEQTNNGAFITAIGLGEIVIYKISL